MVTKIILLVQVSAVIIVLIMHAMVIKIIFIALIMVPTLIVQLNFQLFFKTYS